MDENIRGDINENPQQSENEIIRIRREKLEAYKAAGNDPYSITKFDFTALSEDVKNNFETYEGKTVIIAGRMMSRRIMGKASFCHIRDNKGQIQVYVKRDEIGENEYADFKKWDIGDIAGVTGVVFRTQTGEVSIHAAQIKLLSKSLRPLPEKFHGLRDTDMRYRQRYVDLIVNPEVRNTFIMRSNILKELRNYLDNLGFLEVDTPILHTISIGANARPFKTFHNTLSLDMYLRIETELYLKRLIVGGFDRVYEVGRIFRNEGMDTRHNPEFTSIELYQAYTDYIGMMDLVEDMYKTVTQKICGKTKISWQGIEIDIGSDWTRLTMREAVLKYSGADYNTWNNDNEAREAAAALGVKTNPSASRGEVLADLFEIFVEDKLVQPTFIYEYPVEISPLAKRCPNETQFTERFEFFINCSEMGNAFSELNDPIDQRARFETQVEQKKAAGMAAEVDDDYICALEYGLPPTGGLGFGIDRMVMLLTDNASIRDVLLFPTMKPLE